MAKVLITGGGGYIGQACARSFLARGWGVVLLDRNPANAFIDPQALLTSGGRFVKGDVRDRSVVEAAMSGCNAVVHLAAISSVPQSIADPETTMSVNVEGTQTVLDVAEALKLERVIIASSAAVYGANPEMPLHEGMELESLSPYAESKRLNEAALLHARERGLNGVALRFFNVYGGNQLRLPTNTSVIPSFIRTMLAGTAPHMHGDGSQTRDFIHVDDLSSAVCALAERKAPYEAAVANVCSGVEHSLLDLVDAINHTLIRMGVRSSALVPTHADNRAGDIHRSLGTNARLRSLIEWSPEISLQHGLEAMIREGLEASAS